MKRNLETLSAREQITALQQRYGYISIYQLLELAKKFGLQKAQWELERLVCHTKQYS